MHKIRKGITIAQSHILMTVIINKALSWHYTISGISKNTCNTYALKIQNNKNTRQINVTILSSEF